MALGEALNLSGGGAWLALQTRALMVGDEVILWLNFARPGHSHDRWPRVAAGCRGEPPSRGLRRLESGVAPGTGGARHPPRIR